MDRSEPLRIFLGGGLEFGWKCSCVLFEFHGAWGEELVKLVMIMDGMRFGIIWYRIWYHFEECQFEE